MARKILINYRRADSKGYAVAIYNSLVSNFGEDQIFMDIDAIEPGTDFVKVLEKAIQQCDVLIVIIGPQWLGIKDASGEKRLDNKSDFVRIEIKAALEREVTVLPVLVQGVKMPSAAKLPDDIRSLARRQAFVISDRFSTDVEQLVEVLNRILERARRERLKKGKAEKKKKKTTNPLIRIPSFARKWPEKVLGKTPVKAEVKPKAAEKARMKAPVKPIPKTTRRISYALSAAAILVISYILFKNMDIFTRASKPAENAAISSSISTKEPIPTEISAATEIPAVKYPISETEVMQITATPEIPSSSTTWELIPTTISTLGIGSTMNSEADGMTMVYIPAGEFLMGSKEGDADADDDEFPQHTVYLTAYWIDRMEVTNAQYQKCVSENACDEPGDTAYFNDSNYRDHPVVHIDWYDAQAYCGWAGRRLPTEAQWEKAARGTDGRTYPWGEGMNCNLANYGGCDEVPKTSPAGHYPEGASLYKVLDMAGNVWEWAADRYDSSYYGRSPTENPTGPKDGFHRVLRGGSWLNDVRLARSAYRLNGNPDAMFNDIGFRCALSP